MKSILDFDVSCKHRKSLLQIRFLHRSILNLLSEFVIVLRTEPITECVVETFGPDKKDKFAWIDKVEIVVRLMSGFGRLHWDWVFNRMM